MSDRLPECLHTERLVLREPRIADAQAIFETYAQDNEVSRYLVWRPSASVKETEDFIAGCVRDFGIGWRRAYVLALCGSTERPIGMLDARLSSHRVELGYVLARSHWGRGLMPEAVRAVVSAALALSAVFRAQAVCDVENRASARVLEKCGFVLEGRLERYIVHVNVSAEPRACFLYARCR